MHTAKGRREGGREREREREREEEEEGEEREPIQRNRCTRHKQQRC
jgi:hypothetical protein